MGNERGEALGERLEVEQALEGGVGEVALQVDVVDAVLVA